MMDDRTAGLIGVLLDPVADLGGRDDAAMDLGACNDDRALAALIQIATDENQNEMLLDSCGESIADIWLVRRYHSQEVFDSLTRIAQNAVYVTADVTKEIRRNYL